VATDKTKKEPTMMVKQCSNANVVHCWECGARTANYFELLFDKAPETVVRLCFNCGDKLLDGYYPYKEEDYAGEN
jgi:hypothetical protein